MVENVEEGKADRGNHIDVVCTLSLRVCVALCKRKKKKLTYVIALYAITLKTAA